MLRVYELSERAKRILCMLVDYYIKTGDPIGSVTLVNTYGLPLKKKAYS